MHHPSPLPLRSRFLATGMLGLALSIFASPIAPVAAAAGAQPYGHREMNAPIDLDDAYRLPAAYVLDTAFDRNGDVLDGRFTVYNGETDAIASLRYNIDVLQASGGSGDLSLFFRTSVREDIALSGKEKRSVPFHVVLPALPAGSYVFRIQVASSEGRYLGWHDTPFSVQEGPDRFLSITHTAIDLPEFAGQDLEPMTGPNVSAGGEVGLNAVLRNPGASPITVLPTLDTYVFDMVRGDGERQEFPPVTLAAGEERTVRLPVTAGEQAEVYAGILRFVDPATGDAVSPLAEYRWIVRGADADIFPLRVSQVGTKKGESTLVDVDVVGAADAETVTDATLVIDLVDDQGVLATTGPQPVSLSDSIYLSEAGLRLPRDARGGTRIRVSVLDASGAVLATRTDAVPGGQTSVAAAKLEAVASRGITAFAFLAAAALSAYAIASIASRNRKTGLRTATAIVAALLLFLTQTNVLLAAGNGNGIEVFAPNESGVYFHGLRGPVIALFINAPIHDAPAGTYQKNAVPLQYRVTYGVCYNKVAYARVLGRVDKNGGKQNTYDGVGAAWETVHDKLFSDTYQQCISKFGGPVVPYVCLSRDEFNGTLDLSSVLPPNICSTTLQLLGKANQTTAPNASFEKNAAGNAVLSTYGWAHSVDLWLNFQCNTAKPQCSDAQDNDGDGKVDGADPGCHSDGNPYNPVSYNPNDNDEANPGNAQCNDGADNDADGKADMQDPGCHSDGNAGNTASYVPLDNDEFNAASSSSAASVPQCRDGIDNDGDGATDYPSDFSCSSSEDNDETFPKAQCQDGIDNDGDGLTDFPQDPGCSSRQDNDEFNQASSASSAPFTPQCRDNIDNDGDGAVDYPSDFSCSSSEDNDETLPKAQCQDGFDNDGDGKPDTQDPGCHYDGNANNGNSFNPQDNDEFNAVSSSSASSALPQCRDGLDNDNDGAADYPSDFSCSHPDDTDETFPKAQCQDGIDNDGDGLTDFPNDPGCQSRQDDNEFNTASSSSSSAVAQCRDAIDNDGDGAVDYYDSGCYTNGIYNPNDNDESTQASSSSSSAGALGCILVLNETFNAAGQPLQPSAQFTYTLDGQRTTANDAGGVARFDNVVVGTHTVTQGGNSAWTTLSVTPMGGTVWVPGGTACAAAVFKNKQNSVVGGQSSSAYSWYDPYDGDDGYDEDEETPLCRALRAKYGERYDNVKKRKKLPKSIRKALEECDHDGSPYGGYGYGSR